NTIVYENILKMWARAWARGRSNSVWLINQNIEPELFSMAQTVGTGGVPVYLPANGISGSPYSTLMGRPVLPVEQASTLGTKGDIMLVDLDSYLLIDKAGEGVKGAESIHVAFATDEKAFRFTYRVNGQPIWQSALTSAKGTATLSPFVTLNTRA
ncbi:MAG: phage major capsid protein, partial [Mameliella sp.]|nr:phage major capsid protein [Mameliella sp.]